MSSGSTSWFDAASDPPSPEETQTLLADVAATQIIRTDAKKPDAAVKPEATRPPADATQPIANAAQPKANAVQTKADVAPPKADAPQSDAPQAKADTAQPKADAAQPTADAAQPKSNPLRLKIDVERPKTEAGGADQTQILLTPTPAENSETRIIRTDAPARKPVFVDSTGRRGKRVRRVAYGLALAVLLAVAAVWVSQFDSWAKPPAPTTSGVTK